MSFRLTGHVRTFVDCRGTNSNIHTYALLDTLQPRPVMVLVLFTADSVDMPNFERMILENLVVGVWQEPESEWP